MSFLDLSSMELFALPLIHSFNQNMFVVACYWPDTMISNGDICSEQNTTEHLVPAIIELRNINQSHQNILLLSVMNAVETKSRRL